MKKFITLLLVFFSLLSCDYFSLKKKSENAIARANDSYLYKEDLQGLITTELSEQDSIMLITNFINNWINQQLLFDRAKINLKNEKDRFKSLVRDYEQDLFINAYKQAVVDEYLDTTITNYDVEKYYKENAKNFKLNEELLKLKYVKLDKVTGNKNEVIQLLKAKDSTSKLELETKKMSFVSYHLNDSVWIKYSELISEVPILKEVDKTELLKKGYFVEKEDSLNVYLVSVKNALNRNELAPRSYIAPTIKQMILHQRKLLLLKNMEKTLIEDAKKNNQFEIY